MAALPAAWSSAAHERVIDALLSLASQMRAAPVSATGVVVVDIDARSLAAIGPWPWPRARIADLAAAAGRGGAAAIALDILFEGVDAKSPATLARRLGEQTGRADLFAWADSLEDGDRLLAGALAGAPSVLGFALAPSGGTEVSGVPFLTTGAVALPALWRTHSAIAPLPDLADNAAGLGTLALPGDEDGLVHRVPLLAGVGQQVRPGLAAEAVRVAQGATSYRIDGTVNTLQIGNVTVPIPPQAMLRLLPDAPAFVTLSAANVLASASVDPRLRGAVVLIGSSAPELGGLRPAPGDPLTPSVMLQARAVWQLLRGIVPLPVPHGAALDWALSLAATLAGLLAAVLLRPLRGAVAIAALLLGVAAAALAAAAGGRLFDPSAPIVLAIVGFAATALVTAAETQLREARIRQRFSQHLAPAVVERIAASPGLLKLAGERREITALFTDIEGFTSMTQRAGPEALVTMLDGYFEGVVRIVIAHGGMIDKFVGDAVHAFFNMPLDLPDHPALAVACALAIRDWTEGYRREPLPAQYGFGRTRLGLETGEAVVGDIGIGAKLDYTAHGDTVNGAARLEAANKEIGSAICVGPGAAARCPPDLLRPSGSIHPRGFAAPVQTFEPWPHDADPAWRARYLAACALAATNPTAAADSLDELSAARPADAVIRRLAGQFRAATASSRNAGTSSPDPS